MSVPRRIVVALLWVLSLVAVGAWAQSGTPMVRPGAGPEVIAGPDMGFQVDRYRGETPVGSLVIKRDGKWVEVEFGARVRTAR